MESHTPDLTVPGATPTSNPFSLIVDPQAVLDAVQRSERLLSLQRRVYRPLGQPLTAEREADATGFDTSMESESLDTGLRPRAGDDDLR